MAAVLAFAAFQFRLAIFKVQLHVAEFIRRHDVVFLGNRHAILDFPRRGVAIVFVAPLRQIFAVEQNDRVARRRRVFAERAGSHDRRLRPRRIVDVP